MEKIISGERSLLRCDNAVAHDVVTPAHRQTFAAVTKCT
jgi:hypothetical protein